MSKYCAVPNCKTGYKSLKMKSSYFRVPTNSERLKKWQAAIPGKKLIPSHLVCEKHFEEKYISRKYIKHDANGKVIAEVIYKRPRLHESAVPTIFESNEQIFKTIQKEELDIVDTYLENEVAASPTHNLFDVTVAINESPIVKVEPETEFILPDLPNDVAEEEATDLATNIIYGPIAAETPVLATRDTTFNISSVTITEKEATDLATNIIYGPIAAETPVLATRDTTFNISSVTEKAATDLAFTNITNEPIAAETPVLVTTCGTTYNISSVTITENKSSAHPDNSGGYSVTLPMPWIVGQLPRSQSNQYLVFLYTVTLKRQKTDIPITQRCVTLDEQKNLRYYIYGNLVNTDATNLVQKLDNITMLPSILTNFQYKSLCCGMGDVKVRFMQAEDTFKNYADQWHHGVCSLLCSRRRCDSCTKLRRKVLQKERRSINPHYGIRISGLSNPVDKYKLQVIQRKMLRKRREKNQAKNNRQN
ncbi:uncharacterized protein [Temnothorax nylanderi]|uniref:uncharacterized protein n=1 Tax=Temnothorax nylanderi TaxID=102681 RepID=UPI003A8360E5